MDAQGGSAFQLVGSQQLLSVPFAYYAAQTGQNLQPGEGLEITDNTLINTAPDQPITLTGEGSIQVTGEYPDFTLIGSDSVTDADSDPANESISALSLGTDNILRITEGGVTKEVDLTSLAATGSDDQTLVEVLTQGNDAGGATITNLADPANPQEAVTKNYVDNLNFDDADPDLTNELITGAQLSGTDLEITDAGGTQTVDLSSLDNPGTDDQTLTEVLGEGNSAGSTKIVDVADPTADQDVATKAYVDAADAAATNNYAFRVDFDFAGPIGAPTLVNFDNHIVQINVSGVISGTDFTAPVDGIYLFFVTGTSDDDIPISILKNGSASEVATVLRLVPFDAFSPVPYSGIFMFAMLAGEKVQIRVESAAASENVQGSFFGNRL